jgi:cofilin
VSVLRLTDLSLSPGKCWARCHDNDAQTLIRLRLSVNPDCVSAFNDLKLKAGRGGPKYIIYKISDDQKEIVVDEIGSETDYDVFREKLVAKKEGTGKDRPSYAIYDVEFELEGGEGKRFVIARQ